jgi:hypothetical protein
MTGLQLLWAMRRNLESCIALVSVAAFYGTAVLCELGVLTAKDRRGVMIEEGCEMLGNFCLLTSMLLFARHLAAGFKHQNRNEVHSFSIGEERSEPSGPQINRLADQVPA